MNDTVFIILGNQLFPVEYLNDYKSCTFYMAEDYGLCTYEKHHKKKIALFLTAMRDYKDYLESHGCHVHYTYLERKNFHYSYEELLKQSFKPIKRLISFEIEDKFFELRVKKFCIQNKIEWTILPSPMFLNSRSSFEEYLKSQKKPFMKSFYEKQRHLKNILMEKNGQPMGGQWSYDALNRKKLSKKISIPKAFADGEVSKHLHNILSLVKEHFETHPGVLDNFEYPTSRTAYLKNINHFLHEKIQYFGFYQDALSKEHSYLFHSVLSPGLNLGLITPIELLEQCLKYYETHDVPINCVEGFIRQVLGWREFIRGIYQNFSDLQSQKNYWNHTRTLKKAWYTGETGIPVLDDTIHRAVKHGYNHHIERLMVIGNMMLLCEIEPRQVHRWFMEMYVDSSNWVMGPNVYGMALFSDGGVFATKPYICGSNYWLKMSHYKKGDWCTIVDGLYWRFIHQHQDFFKRNPRMSMMLSHLDKMNSEKKEVLFLKAQEFIEKVTYDNT